MKEKKEKKSKPKLNPLIPIKLEDIGDVNQDPLELKEIPYFKDYFASNTGYIFKKTPRGIKSLKSVIGHRGYLTVGVRCADGKKHRRKIHRLVALAWIPNPHNYPIVCHIDNNVQNNHKDNLYWGTQSMNMQQMVRDGRQRKSKLIKYSEKVLKLYHQGFTGSEIKRMMPHLSRTSIGRMIHGKLNPYKNE